MNNLLLEKKEERLKLKDLLKYICGYGLNIIPIVDKNKRLVGVITKENLIATSSTIINLEKPLKEFIANNIVKINLPKDFQILLNLSKDYQKIKEIPVIDEEGNLIDYWNVKEILLSIDQEVIFSAVSWKKIFNELPLITIITDKRGRIILGNRFAKEHIFKNKEWKNNFLSEIIPQLDKISERKKLKKLSIEGEKYSCFYNLVREEERILGKIFILIKDRERENLEEEDLNKSIPCLKEAVLKTEKNVIQKALKKTKGNITATANLLNIPRQTLQYKMRRLGLKENKD
jgi:transcriptional regulator with PAS, ATPase and Fis domain